MTHPATRPDWWRRYFTTMYGNLYRGPMSVHLETGAETGAVCRLLPVGEGPVLDLGCGHGRHLETLISEGLAVFGLDWSPDLLGMLSPASRRHAVRGDMRCLPVADGSLGGVYLLFNTFGYFDNVENSEVLGEIARVLRPNGKLLMDLPSRSGMRAVIREMGTTSRGYGDARVVENWDIDDPGHRIVSTGTWEMAGQRQEWEMSLRLYTPNEIHRMLRKAGFNGPIEIRALEDIDDLGGTTPAPPLTGNHWRTSTNMVLLAVK